MNVYWPDTPFTPFGRLIAGCLFQLFVWCWLSGVVWAINALRLGPGPDEEVVRNTERRDIYRKSNANLRSCAYSNPRPLNPTTNLGRPSLIHFSFPLPPSPASNSRVFFNIPTLFTNLLHQFILLPLIYLTPRLRLQSPVSFCLRLSDLSIPPTTTGSLRYISTTTPYLPQQTNSFNSFSPTSQYTSWPWDPSQNTSRYANNVLQFISAGCRGCICLDSCALWVALLMNSTQRD